MRYRGENNECRLLFVFGTLSEFLVSYNVYTKQTAVFAVEKLLMQILPRPLKANI